MHSSAREAKLQALLIDHTEVRKQVGELMKTYETFLAEDVRGTRFTHMVGTMQLMQRPDIAFDKTQLCDSNLADTVLLLLAQFLNRKHRMTQYHTSGSQGDMVSPRVKLLDKFSL